MTHQQQAAFENIVGKGEIARNEQFLLFPQCFLHNQMIVSPSVNIFDTIPLFAGEFEEPKVGISGKGLRQNSRLVQIQSSADNKINLTQNLKFVLGNVENILGKGENAGYQHFLLFPKCFQKFLCSGSLKVGIYVVLS